MAKIDPNFPDGNNFFYTRHEATGSEQGIPVPEDAVKFRVCGVGQTIDVYGTNITEEPYAPDGYDIAAVTIDADVWSDKESIADPRTKFVIVKGAAGADTILCKWYRGLVS